MKDFRARAELDALVSAAKSDGPPEALVEQLRGALAHVRLPSSDVASLAPRDSMHAAAGGGSPSALFGVGGAVKAGVGVVAVGLAVMGGARLMQAPSRDQGGASVIEVVGHAPQATQVDAVRSQSLESSRQEREPFGTQTSSPEAAWDETLAVRAAAKTEPLAGRIEARKTELGALRKGKDRGATSQALAETSAQSITAELTMIDEARRALRTDAARALALTEQCAVEFPSGAAATERRVIAIEALVRLGRKQEAERRLAAFEAAHAGSFHLPYLRRLIVKDAAE